MVGKISQDNYSNYLSEIGRFVCYCKENYLHLNVGKTREMIIDFRRNAKKPDPVMIDGAAVERTCVYTYLGTRLDNKLRFFDNVDFIIKKANSRMYCLSKLRSFDVNPKVLSMFYSASVLSILSFGIVCWGM